MREIQLSRIKPNPRQPRRSFPEAELGELAESIKKHGVLQPVLVRSAEWGFELVSGERRLRAAKIAGLDTLPAIIIDPEDDIGSLTVALVENVQRADLGVIELARAYKLMQDEYGRTQDEIARTVGKSRPHIANTLRLLDLDEPIQEALQEGKITAGHARALLMTPPEFRNILFQRMIRESISVRQAERAARAASKPKSDRIEKQKAPISADTDLAVSRMVLDMERVLERALGRRCVISRGENGKGKIVLEFYSDKDLEALVKKLALN